MPPFSITEFDLFLLSYDEPNADKHWADLIDKAPWAERVHGVKGFDAAHRACAERANTDWFVTVDADNIVDPAFFDVSVEFDPEKQPNRCFSWNALNMINGLQYGNGGLKLWSKRFVLGMNTHENADDPRKAVDFCWEDDYRQMHQTFSQVWNNGSAYQAFRVGYREGVKLSLDRGLRVPAAEMRERLHPVNLRNLRIWCSVGADRDHGLWAMLGARMGWRDMCDPSFDHTSIRDYDLFKGYWDDVVRPEWGDFDPDMLDRGPHRDTLVTACRDYGDEVARATGIDLPVLDPATSILFRDCLALRND